MTLKPELVAALEKRARALGWSSSRMVESLLQEGLGRHAAKAALWEARLGVSSEQVAGLCRALRLKRLSLFGSALRDDLRPDSDVDLLAEFLPGAVRTLLDRGRVQMEFESLFGRKVDLTEWRLVDNPIRRREIQAGSEEIYAA